MYYLDPITLDLRRTLEPIKGIWFKAVLGPRAVRPLGVFFSQLNFGLKQIESYCSVD
jgi:hypothetical protein